MWFTDATIAFVKETLSNLEGAKKENNELEEKLNYYVEKLNQCNMVLKNTSEEFRKSIYVKVDPDDDMQKPVLVDEAIEILSKKVGELGEQLEYGRKQQELNTNLLNTLTKDYFPGILDEING